MSERLYLEWPAAHVAHVSMTGGGLNPLDLELVAGLAGCLDKLAGETRCRAVVLSSRDRHFCAGAISKFTTDGAVWTTADLYAQVPAIARFPRPLVIAMNGGAVGGGAGLALLGDWRQIARDAYIHINFTRLGYTPGFGLTRTLPSLVGEHRATEILLSARKVRAEEAVRIGLCDAMSEPGDLIEDALSKAEEYASAAPLAVGALLSAARSRSANGLETVLAQELAQQNQLRSTNDYAEGMTAMKERRPPEFEGR